MATRRLPQASTASVRNSVSLLVFCPRRAAHQRKSCAGIRQAGRAASARRRCKVCDVELLSLAVMQNGPQRVRPDQRECRAVWAASPAIPRRAAATGLQLILAVKHQRSFSCALARDLDRTHTNPPCQTSAEDTAPAASHPIQPFRLRSATLALLPHLNFVDLASLPIRSSRP